MKVFVTGGAGYVGSTACAEILRAGHSVRVFDRLIYGGESLLSLMGHPSFDLVVGDIRDQAALRDALHGCDAVIHLAGIVGEPACSINEDKAWSINASGSRSVIAAARDSGIERLLYVSTCSNYGVANTAALASEDTPLNPISNYAKAKVEAEQVVLAERGDLSACVFRLGTICGVSPRMRFDLLISDLARLAVFQRPIDIFAPEAWRPFLHVRDAAEAFLVFLSASTEQIDGKVYNVVGENAQKTALVALVRAQFPNASIAVTNKAPDLRDYRVGSTRFVETFQSPPRRSVSDAFDETVVALRAGIFRDPFWEGHSAIPLDPSLIN